MSNDNNGNDEETKHDLTRVEDLSEFLHQDDPETDAIFQEAEEDEELPPPFEVPSSSIDDLDDQDEDFALEAQEDSFENSDDDFSDEPTVTDFDLNESENFEEAEDDFQDESQDDLQEEFQDDLQEDFQEGPQEEFQEDLQEDLQEDFQEDSAEGFQEGFQAETSDDFQADTDDQLEDPEDFGELPELPADSSDDIEEDFEDPEEVSVDFEEEPSQELTDIKESHELGEIIDSIDLKEIEVAPLDIEQQVPEIATTPASERESFSEVRDFANSMSYGTVKVGGNPAFSLLLRDIVSDDCHDSIVAILNEHGLLGSEENLIRTSLEIGHLLIPQISEFSAVYLAGKLRKYARDVQIGLAQEIHDSKSYDNDSKGLVTKRSIFQNKDLSFKRSESEFNPEEVLSSTQSKISGHEISQHLGIVSSSGVYELGDLTEQTLEYESQPSEGEIAVGSNEIYSLLLKTLKINAFQLGANAVVSVNYTMTPIQEESTTRYNIICTGDAVIIE
jgi:uncharacterized protein YbjQ (UPF0145 family)